MVRMPGKKGNAMTSISTQIVTPVTLQGSVVRLEPVQIAVGDREMQDNGTHARQERKCDDFDLDPDRDSRYPARLRSPPRTSSPRAYGTVLASRQRCARRDLPVDSLPHEDD